MKKQRSLAALPRQLKFEGKLFAKVDMVCE